MKTCVLWINLCHLAGKSCGFCLFLFFEFIPILILSLVLQGAKKVIFTAYHSGKLKLTFTGPNVILTSPKSVLMSRLSSQFFCNLNSSKKFTCLSGKLIIEFTSPMAKSTTPGLSDTTFFARWCYFRLTYRYCNSWYFLLSKWKYVGPVWLPANLAIVSE